eukprot:472729-Prymnesium_polylepis.1
MPIPRAVIAKWNLFTACCWRTVACDPSRNSTCICDYSCTAGKGLNTLHPGRGPLRVILVATPHVCDYGGEGALPSPPPGRSPSAPVPRVDRYAIEANPGERSAPGFAVSGDGGVDPRAPRPAHRACQPSWMGWSDG